MIMFVPLIVLKKLLYLLIIDTHTLRIPKVFDYGTQKNGSSFIIMEYLNFGGGSDDYEFGK